LAACRGSHVAETGNFLKTLLGEKQAWGRNKKEKGKGEKSVSTKWSSFCTEF